MTFLALTFYLSSSFSLSQHYSLFLQFIIDIGFLVSFFFFWIFPLVLVVIFKLAIADSSYSIEQNW